ncbi:TonB-dependent receptor [Sediminihaliea albiluteola]|uniref:TonB-dependent receptor n=1 Tax=Sediminihaliea albiluteola TaxID=2758564 RepID=UPI002E2A91F0|nr:TonB-dependent receptor [Sediminihaliea albiluteola]
MTAGIAITGGADGFGKVIRIRGVGTNSYVPAIRPAVGIFIDDIPLGAPESAYNNMADIERIEILKGPQATLFGKEVSSGAISLFTRRPDTQLMDAYVEGNFGNLGKQEFRLGGNLPLGDHFGLRASVYNNQSDGSITNISYNNKRMGDVEATGYRLRLLWEASDNFSAILGYEDHDVEVYGTNSLAQEHGDLYTIWEQSVLGISDPAQSKLDIIDPYSRKNSHSAPNGLRNSLTKIWSLNMNWEINDNWSITSVTSDQEWSNLTPGDDGSGFVNSAGQRVYDTADTSVGPYKLNDFYQDAATDTTTQELRVNWEDGDWSSVFGAFYAQTDTISYVPFSNLLGAFGPNLIIKAAGLSDLREDISEWALFSHNIYSIREGLDLTFGARYSNVEKESLKGQMLGVGPLADLNSPFVPATLWADNIPKQKDSWDEISGTVKLTYWLNDEISIYGGWDRGFKAGGHNVCKGDLPEADCPPPFASEIADNFEIGMKSRLFDNSLVFNTALFYQSYDDYQVDIQDEEGIGNSVQNAAKVKIQGIEAEFQWLATDQLRIDGNLSYVDARWDEYADAECLRPQYQAIACTQNPNGSFTQDLGGQRLNYTSPWTGNVNATYSGDFGNGIGWYVRGEVAFRDDRLFFPDLDPDVRDGSYTLLNASAGISAADGTWDVIFWAKNLADEEYLINAERNRDQSNPNFGGTPYEGYRVTAGDERTYGVTLKYRFNES